MRKRSFTVAVPVALLVILMTVSIVSASTAGNGRSQANDSRSYWTPENIKRAIPRDIVLDAHGAPTIPMKPGNGGGGNGRGNGGGSGDDSTGTVTGKSWTTDGVVKGATGKLFFRMGGTGFVCTGSVVSDTQTGRSLVLTAGHCVYDEGADGSGHATDVVFIPDFDSDPSSSYFSCTTAEEKGLKCWVVDHTVTSAKWASGDSDKWSEDYGFGVVLDSSNFGISLEASSGTLAIDTTTHALPLGQQIHAFGYPAAKKYNGRDLVYCAGPDGQVNDGNPETTSIACKMTGGASGGPWLLGFDSGDQDPVGVVRSLTSYSYSSANGFLFGPIFDEYTQAVYDVADTASASEVVPAP